MKHEILNICSQRSSCNQGSIRHYTMALHAHITKPCWWCVKRIDGQQGAEQQDLANRSRILWTAKESAVHCKVGTTIAEDDPEVKRENWVYKTAAQPPSSSCITQIGKSWKLQLRGYSKWRRFYLSWVEKGSNFYWMTRQISITLLRRCWRQNAQWDKICQLKTCLRQRLQSSNSAKEKDLTAKWVHCCLETLWKAMAPSTSWTLLLKMDFLG